MPLEGTGTPDGIQHETVKSAITSTYTDSMQITIRQVKWQNCTVSTKLHCSTGAQNASCGPRQDPAWPWKN